MTNRPTAVVLAAGKGTRMKSDLPKVLFPVLGRAMIHWVLDALERSDVGRKIVVVGYRDDLVRRELAERDDVEFVVQAQQLGTGHAVKVCSPLLTGAIGPVLVLAGDSPLVQPRSLSKLIGHYEQIGPACLLGTLVKDNPVGLGRIVRSESGRFLRIVEHKDATPDEREIREVNMSTYLFNPPDLLWALGQLQNKNSQSEYYLTDCPELLVQSGKVVDAMPVLEACESLSINTVEELAVVEAKMQELGYACTN